MKFINPSTMLLNNRVLPFQKNKQTEFSENGIKTKIGSNQKTTWTEPWWVALSTLLQPIQRSCYCASWRTSGSSETWDPSTTQKPRVKQIKHISLTKFSLFTLLMWVHVAFHLVIQKNEQLCHNTYPNLRATC